MTQSPGLLFTLFRQCIFTGWSPSSASTQDSTSRLRCSCQPLLFLTLVRWPSPPLSVTKLAATSHSPWIRWVSLCLLSLTIMTFMSLSPLTLTLFHLVFLYAIGLWTFFHVYHDCSSLVADFFNLTGIIHSSYSGVLQLNCQLPRLGHCEFSLNFWVLNS